MAIIFYPQNTIEYLLHDRHVGAADTAKGRASKNLKVLIGKTTLAYWQQRILIYACI